MIAWDGVTPSRMCLSLKGSHQSSFTPYTVTCRTNDLTYRFTRLWLSFNHEQDDEALAQDSSDHNHITTCLLVVGEERR